MRLSDFIALTQNNFLGEFIYSAPLDRQRGMCDSCIPNKSLTNGFVCLFDDLCWEPLIIILRIKIPADSGAQMSFSWYFRKIISLSSSYFSINPSYFTVSQITYFLMLLLFFATIKKLSYYFCPLRNHINKKHKVEGTQIS